MITLRESVVLNQYYNETLTVTTCDQEIDAAKDGMEDVIGVEVSDGATTWVIGTSLEGAEKAIEALQKAVDLLKGKK